MINTHEGTSIITRIMLPDEVGVVRSVADKCHSINAAKALTWFIAHPTIVAEYEGQIVGYTSYALAMIPGHGEVMYGMDMGVLPEHRGKGIARGLHLARLGVGKSVGIKIFMGVTNDPGMAKILKQYGAHACVSTGMGTMYVGEIKEDM